MSVITKRTTVYLDPILHKALRIKASNTSRSMSYLINEAVREALKEDADDLAAFDARSDEPVIKLDAFVKKLKSDGIL